MATGAGHVPHRTCIICGTKDSKVVMIRLVAAPDGVRVDLTGRADGRGAYVCRRPECDKTLLKARRLSYALRTAVPESLTRSLITDMPNNGQNRMAQLGLDQQNR